MFTSSRADYGLLHTLLKEISSDAALELQLYVSGTHLSQAYGNFAAVIEKEFPDAVRVDAFLASGSEAACTKSIALLTAAFADLFARQRPDVLLLLGDRYELLGPATAALLARVPIAHVHGGEVTEGAIDEAVRHAVTKLALYHFVTTEEYKRRVEQLGEDPSRIFVAGAPGLDMLASVPLLSKRVLAHALQFSFEEPVALICLHPETLRPEISERSVDAILSAVRRHGLRAVFTKSNADPGSQIIDDRFLEFTRQDNKRYLFVDHLGSQRFFSCLRHTDLMIGNSSSGIIEAPSFGLPVVNIGERQRGRVRGGNIIDVPANKAAVDRAVETALSSAFREKARLAGNPYRSPHKHGASRFIKSCLKTLPLDPSALRKPFVDLL